ncbi:MAG: hypothetical protein ACON4R_01510 [Akkermansiaceae bacterium]
MKGPLVFQAKGANEAIAELDDFSSDEISLSLASYSDNRPIF